MRLDGRKGDHGWTVFHVPRAQRLIYTTWVDDETHQWAELPQDFSIWAVLAGTLDPVVHQAKLIRIIPSKKLVLIDPVDDPDNEKDMSEIDSLRIKAWLTRISEDVFALN